MIRKHLNFIPEELRPGIEIPAEWIPAGLVVLFAVYAAQWPIRIAIQSKLREEELVILEKQSKELNERLDVLSNQAKVETRNNQSLKEIQTVLNRKNYWSEIFKEMSVLIPENVWLTRFLNQKPKLESKTPMPERAPASGTPAPVLAPAEELIVEGEAVSQISIARFLTILEKSHYFSGARLVSSQQVKDSKPAKFKFQFNIPVKTGSREKTL